MREEKVGWRDKESNGRQKIINHNSLYACREIKSIYTVDLGYYKKETYQNGKSPNCGMCWKLSESNTYRS